MTNWNENKNQNKGFMRIVTINVPNSYITAFESMIYGGQYNNRSQIVREALKDFLEKEKEFTVDLKNFDEIKGFE